MPQTGRPFLFAITGGIASGKSLFAQLINRLGLQTIDTDQIAHDVIDFPSIRKILLARWGERIIDQGKLNREMIASIVFHDPQELKVLNQLLHPIIIREMSSIVDKCNNPFLGFEIPLLFETGLQKCFDLNILITAKKHIREHILLERGMDREEAMKRINSQMEEIEKLELADIVIHNDYNLETFECEAIRVYNLIKQNQKKEIQSFTEYFQHN